MSSDELKIFEKDMSSAFFRYAQITASIEIYMEILREPKLQKIISKSLFGNETEWKEIHRYMVIDGKTIVWYPEISVIDIINQRDSILGWIYGITMNSMISSLDFFLYSILKNYFQYENTSGSSWNKFIEKTDIDLTSKNNGKTIYVWLQERHKIQHNQARIDDLFLKNMRKYKIDHEYKEGDSIKKSHLEILHSYEIIKEFTENIDEEVLNKIH